VRPAVERPGPGPRSRDDRPGRCCPAAEKRLEMRRGTWRGRQRGRLPFSTWAAEWWETWTADDPSPTTLAATESWLRLHVRPWFTDRPIDKITPADVRRWQAQLAQNVGLSTLAHCRSLALRIFQYAMDEGAIDTNPVHKVPPPKRRVDPEQVFTEAKWRALTPEEAGRLLACFPLFWWDHVPGQRPSRPAQRPTAWPAPARPRAQQLIDGDVQCDHEVVEDGAHEASLEVGVVVATPILGGPVTSVTARPSHPQSASFI
jgi:hypothetical protein